MDRYDELVHKLCVDLGWCGSKQGDEYRHVDDFIPKDGKVTASEFAEWVILADGEDPNSELSNNRFWKERIEKLFIEYMGVEEIEAKLLK